MSCNVPFNFSLRKLNFISPLSIREEIVLKCSSYRGGILNSNLLGILSRILGFSSEGRKEISRISPIYFRQRRIIIINELLLFFLWWRNLHLC